jgi:hypothetical protein
MLTHRRIGEIALGLFEVLWDQPDGVSRAELLPLVWRRVPPTDLERSMPERFLGGWTTGLVKAGWIRKQNRRWYLTNEGRAAYSRYRNADPAALTRELAHLYQVAMAEISGRSLDAAAAAPLARGRRPPASSANDFASSTPAGRYRPHPDRERRLASAVAVATFALAAPDLYETHRNELLSFACWWATELDGKYKTRYRSTAARQPGATDLRHEHVVPRKTLREAIEREPDRVADILREALACVVTREEHDRLNTLGSEHEGWERYIAAGIDVFDEQESRPLIQSGQFVNTPASE